MSTNIHRFYILTREPSPFGAASSVTTIRKRVSKGESETGTLKLTKYNSVNDSVTEQDLKRDKVKLSPGEFSEEFLDGATVRWTVEVNGKEHTVVDKITMKELRILTGCTAGLNAWDTIAVNVSFKANNIEDFDLLNPISATFTYAEFINMIHLGKNTQLDFLTENMFVRDIGEDWEDDALRTAIHAIVRGNLPANVSLED